MNQEIGEALAAVEPVTPAVEKIPAGKTVVAIELERDPAVSGKYMTGIGKGWTPLGKAVALQAGRVVAANYIYGMWSNGTPVVSACRAVFCTKCGKVWGLPHAVWAARDRQREQGNAEIFKGVGAWRIIHEHGICMECNARLVENVEAEKKALTALAQKALKDIERMEKVPAFMPPAAFSVVDRKHLVQLDEMWRPFGAVMEKQGKALVPHKNGSRDNVLMYNPGYWLGWVDALSDKAVKGLFFGDVVHARGGANGFNPAGVDGL